MVAFVNFHQARRVQRAVDDVQVVFRQVQRAEERRTDLRRAILFQFKPHGRALAAIVQFVFNRLEQIVGVFFVDVQLAVARDAEMPVTKDICARKQIGEVVADEMAEEDVILAWIVAGQFHQPRQHARHLDHGEMTQHLAALRHFELHHHVQRFVQQLGKRMRRINGQRRHYRADLRAVVVFDPHAVGVAEFGELQKADAVSSQRGDELLAPAGVLLLDHPPDALGDGAKRLAGREAVDVALHHFAFDLLLEPGDADLEQLVEVRTGDAEKFDALQQWRGGIQRFVQHALVEFQPAQLPIDEVGWPKGSCRRHHSERLQTTVTRL